MGEVKKVSHILFGITLVMGGFIFPKPFFFFNEV